MAVSSLPFTSRQQLVEDQAAHPPYGTWFTEPLESYVREESTSGMTGTPLRWLFTDMDVRRHGRLWRAPLEINGVTPSDRVMVGDGAWACWAALGDIGALAIPTPEDYSAQVREIITQRVSVIVGTPSDALRLGEAAAAMGVDLVENAVRIVVVTGEVGGHVPSTRRRIEERFGARCVDVYELIECGVVGWECAAQDEGLHLNEDEFTVEVDEGELVLTAQPLVRYRTGDIVERVAGRCDCGRSTMRARVLGRIGERLTVRGVECFPSTFENIVRRHPAVMEYQLQAYQVHGECELAIDIEPDEAVATEGDRARVAAEVAEDVKRSLGLRLQCEAVPPRSRGRAEARPKRLVVHTSAASERGC